jgi:hypothetical protein
MDVTTKSFVRDVYRACRDADYLSGHKAVQHLEIVVAAVESRDIPHLSFVEAAEVTLSDDDWAEITKFAQLQLASARAEM